MALVPRRVALIAITVAAVLAGVVTPATPALANNIGAPTLLSPANDPSAHLKDIVLKWEDVAGATEYQVQVSPNHEWTSNTVTLPNNGQTVVPLYEMPVSLPNATYFWRVRAQVGGSWGPYSSAWTLVKDWEAPITILKQPTSADPTITWAPVKDASLYLLRYLPPNFIPNGTIGGIPGEVDCWTSSTSITPYAATGEPTAGPGAQSGCAKSTTALPLQNGTQYAWQLIAFDDSTAAAISTDTTPNLEQACQQSAQPLCDVAVYYDQTGFVFEAPAAGTPAKGSVTGLTTSWHAGALPGTTCDASTVCPTTPTFSWNPVSGANYYIVNVFRDPDETNLYRQYATSWPELTPAAGLFDAQAGHPYYWSVEAGTCITAANNPTCAPGTTGSDTCKTGTGTSKPTLDTDPSSIKATPPGPLGDQSMQSGTNATISVIGTGIVGPVCVVPSSGVVDESTVTVGFGGIVTFSYYPTISTTNQQVTFQVVNADGAESNASAPLTVVAGNSVLLYDVSSPATFAKRSGSVTLLSPGYRAVVAGNSPTFKWTDFLNSGADETYDARNYELQVSQDRSFDTTVLDNKDIDLTEYTSPTALLSNGSYYWRVAPIDEAGDVLAWTPIRQFTVNATAPTISFLSASGMAVNQALVIQLSAPLRNISGQTLKVVPVGAPTANALRGRLVQGSSPTIYSFFPRVPLATGGSYGLRLTQPVLDNTGNAAVVSGGPIRTALTALDSNRGWQYSRGWTRHAASGALSGSYEQARAGRNALLQVAGSSIVVYGCKAPNMGHVTFSIAGQGFNVSENQSFTRCGVPLWHAALPGGVRTLHIRVTSGVGNFDAAVVDGGTSTTTGTGTTSGTGSSSGTGTTGTTNG